MIKVETTWFAAVLISAVGAAAGAGAMKVLYGGAQREITALTNERDSLKTQNTGLMEALKRLVDPAELKRCQSQLATVRENKNEAVRSALRELKAQQDEDTATMKALLYKKWSRRDGTVGLSEPDQLIYATANQRWMKYTDDRSTLLKQLVCVP